MDQDHSEFRGQIKESLETKEEEILVPVWFLVAKEFVLAIVAAGIIGYIMDFIVVKDFIKFRDDVTFFPYFTVFIMFFALLTAAYRCWRIRRGMNPNGNW